MSSSAVMPIPVSKTWVRMGNSQRVGASYEGEQDDRKRTSYNKTASPLLVLYGLNGNVHLLCASESLRLSEGCNAELLESIIGIRNEFTKEDIPANSLSLYSLDCGGTRRTGGNTSCNEVGMSREVSGEPVCINVPVDDNFAKASDIALRAH